MHGREGERRRKGGYGCGVETGEHKTRCRHKGQQKMGGGGVRLWPREGHELVKKGGVGLGGRREALEAIHKTGKWATGG